MAGSNYFICGQLLRFDNLFFCDSFVSIGWNVPSLTGNEQLVSRSLQVLQNSSDNSL